jgi:hypothetical protein
VLRAAQCGQLNLKTFGVPLSILHLQYQICSRITSQIRRQRVIRSANVVIPNCFLSSFAPKSPVGTAASFCAREPSFFEMPTSAKRGVVSRGSCRVPRLSLPFAFSGFDKTYPSQRSALSLYSAARCGLPRMFVQLLHSGC